MNTDTEGMLLASHCLAMALIKALIDQGVLKPAQVIELTEDAETVLATLKPSLMSPDARIFAKDVLQKMGRTSLEP